MALSVEVNGQKRTFENLVDGVSLATLIADLGLKEDRIAIERNGEIVPRGSRGETQVDSGDRLEIVHFVGGGCVAS